MKLNKLCPAFVVLALNSFIVCINIASTTKQYIIEDEVDTLRNNDKLPAKEVVKRHATYVYDGDSISFDSSSSEVNAKYNISVGEGSEELRRKRRSKQDLCQHLCTCDTERTEKFVTVSCSFLMDKVTN